MDSRFAEPEYNHITVFLNWLSQPVTNALHSDYDSKPHLFQNNLHNPLHLA